MRRASAAVAALLLAACQVATDGARCEADANCPSGQACGNDGACSARAATCGDERCAPGASRCGASGAVERCTDADPACGAWIPDACEAGLACGTRSGAPACECLPADGALLVADPAGSAPGVPPYATGRADAPARCRFKKLGDALAAAAGGKRVSARNGPFGDATAEVFPLDVAPGVTLEGEGASGVRIETAAPVGSSMLVLHEGATLRRVTLSNEVGAPPGTPPATPTAAVALSCARGGASPPAAATLDAVSIETDALMRGIAIACPAALTDVRVSGARGPALHVNPPDPAYETSVVGGRFGESTTGVEVHGGTVRLAGPDGVSLDPFRGFAAATLDVAANTEHGVAVIGGSTATTLVLERVRIVDNGGTGIRIDDLPSGSSVSVVGCHVDGNRANADGSRYASTRRAGGVILSQANGPPQLDFRGNLISCNGEDQIGLFVVGDVSLAPAACGSDSNVVRTKLTGQVAVYASDFAKVTASNDFWIPVPPSFAAKQFVWKDACPLPAAAPDPCP